MAAGDYYIYQGQRFVGSEATQEKAIAKAEKEHLDWKQTFGRHVPFKVYYNPAGSEVWNTEKGIIPFEA